VFTRVMILGLLIGLSGMAVAEGGTVAHPVAYVTEMQGSWTIADSRGTVRPLALKTPISNDSVVTRTSSAGYFKTIDRNGRVSPNQVEAKVTYHGLAEIEPARQAAFLNYIGGSMARTGKGASRNDFLDWMHDIGTVTEADVDAGMALVFSRGASSAETRRFQPLVMKLSARYPIQSISYRVVQSTLIRAEGELSQQGEDWVLPLRVLGGQPDETLALQLTFRVTDSLDGDRAKTFTLDFPFTIMASDGFLESEIRKVEEALLLGTDQPDRAMIFRLAQLAVYADYGLELAALALWTTP